MKKKIQKNMMTGMMNIINIDPNDGENNNGGVDDDDERFFSPDPSGRSHTDLCSTLFRIFTAILG